MTGSRLDALRGLVAKNPENALARFGLATELLKAGEHEEALVELDAYLARHADEGNAYGRKADALCALGRNQDAREALQIGIETSNRYGHAGMANEFQSRLDELDDA